MFVSSFTKVILSDRFYKKVVSGKQAGKCELKVPEVTMLIVSTEIVIQVPQGRN